MIDVRYTENRPLPSDLSGMTLLDVGCWEGDICAEAIRRGASRVVGVDIGSSERLWQNINDYNFEFLQCDVFSEKFLELGSFDYVTCFGVLYHVENMFSFLYRLRLACKKKLFLECVLNDCDEEHSISVYHPGNSLKNNYSNWWTLNKTCLHTMLETANFNNIHEHHISEPRDYGVQDMLFYRYSVSAQACEYDLQKINPRRSDRMTGNR